MTKLCSCGNCTDAAERAAQFVCKSIDDDECALFTFAICCAMSAIGGSISRSIIQQNADDKGLIGALGVIAKQTEVAAEMNRLINDGTYLDLINEALKRHTKRAEEEEKLQKDT